MSVDAPLFEISESDHGRILRLDGSWTSDLATVVCEAGVTGLSLGPKTEDLSFLRELPELRSLSYLHGGADLGPIHALTNLRRVYFVNVTGPRIDFKAFPQLEECSLEWSSGVANVFDARGLRKLFVHRLPKAKLPQISNLTTLENLSLISCGAASLEPINGLSRLRRLRIAGFRKLEDNRFLAHLKNLRRLTVQACSGFTSLEPLAELEALESIGLEDVGSVESLRPLGSLTQLRRFALYGAPSTKLIDGDLSPMWALPHLEKLIVRGRNGVRWKSPEPKPH